MIYRFVVLVALLCGCAVVGAQQSTDQVTVPLSDSGRPTNLNLQLVKGGITVRGSNRPDVVVIAHVRPGQATNETGRRTRRGALVPAPAFTQGPAFTVTEQRNSVLFVLHTPERAIDFEILVPKHANLRLGTTDVHAPILVEAVEGELEINNPSGPITLNRVGGAIIASSVEGDVRATVTSVSTERPMALSSFNRDVDVTFPPSLKANLKLRSDQGKVSTDFEVTPLAPPAATAETRRQNAPLRIEVNRAVYGAVNGGGPEIELRTFNGNVYVRRAR
jgi:hypothetical protein